MQDPGGKPNGKFEGIIKKLGVTVPAGQELPHLLNLASEQNHTIENLFHTTQTLVDHIATQTERLVGVNSGQKPPKSGAAENSSTQIASPEPGQGRAPARHSNPLTRRRDGYAGAWL